MARLRVNLQAGEFEVEGSEEFVRADAARIDALLGRIEDRAATRPDRTPVPTGAEDAADADAVAVAGAGDAEAPFGALLQALPRSATDVDRMLLAGWHLQRSAADRAFATADANRLLLDHGHKLGNPSQSVKQNLSAKRAFQVSRGRYRVAQAGIDHLDQLSGGRLANG